MEVEEGFLEGLWRALEIEKKAIESYLRWVKELASASALDRRIESILLSMIMDSVLHKNLVKAIIESIQEVRDLQQHLRVSESRLPYLRLCDVAKLLKRVVEEHIEIEQNASSLYRELASMSSKQLIRDTLNAIARDEDRHEEYLKEIESLFS